MSTITNNGGPAFPSEGVAGYDSEGCRLNPFAGHGWEIEPQQGMTLRDYFAAKAMAAIMERYEAPAGKSPIEAYSALARSSYQIADAMIKERTER